MTAKEFLEKAQHEIAVAKLHFADPFQHAEQILLRTLDWTPTQLVLKKKEILSGVDQQKLHEVLSRRLEGEPLQYILGFEYFYESKFFVGPGCLIPRKETELLVDEVLSFFPGKKLKVAELGAGSGNIGMSVLLKRLDIEWHAYEINPESLPYLKKNKETLLKKDAPYFIHFGDFFKESVKFAPYDLVVSNPPYLSESEMNSLSLEVSREPKLALAGGGGDGIYKIQGLLDSLPLLLKPQGCFLCEIGSPQMEALRRELEQRNFTHWEIKKDLSQLPRILKIC